MAENPPLNRIYVLGYSANDRDYPIVSLNADPRVAGYRVPEDLSTCPDKRYPNHVFTGAQPISGDERVRHVWEILPSPWVPFTRYDDDLGPIQGRRRSVKNEGQVASLASDKRVTYEAREGSAIVYTELEETWSIKVDEDGNSLFPIRDRDFYDPSRGPVQERRQLFVPTGEEVGSLENVNGIITQTSYEPYNEFLSVKIVQTYKVDGPQLIGKATDNEGQLVTVTTQRKAAKDYVAPDPTATRTVEVNREDAESLVERIVDTPEIFAGKLFAKEANDPAPLKFRVAAPATTEETTLAGQAQEPSLATGDISKSEQQISKFLKRVRSTFRSLLSLPVVLTQKSTNNEKNLVSITQTLQAGDTTEEPSATKSVESEALGDGTYVVTVSEAPVFAGQVYRATREDLTPQKFKAAQSDTTFEQTIAGTASAPTLGTGEFVKSEEQINKFLKRVSTTSRVIATTSILTELVLTNEGQIGTRRLTLALGAQTFTPSATLVDASVEALGDGRTVKTETTVPKVFAGKTITKTKADLTPEKFKAKQEDITTEESVAGTVATSLTLGSSEFRKSEQQVTEFVKRTSTTTRDTTATSELFEYVVTPEGQLAERTLLLSGAAQSIEPDAKLIDGSIEALGDGRVIVTEVRVDNIFDRAIKSIQKPDTVPEKFNVKNPILRTEEVVEQDSIDGLFLDNDEYFKSQQRLTEHTVQKVETKRNSPIGIEVLGQRLEEAWAVRIPYKEYISESIPSSGYVEADGIGGGRYVIREYLPDDIESVLGSWSVSIPSKINLNLPRVLRDINVRWDETKKLSNSEFDSRYVGAFGPSLTQSDNGSITSTLGLVPIFEITIEEPLGDNLPAETVLFFIKKENISREEIRSKSGAEFEWPAMKPQAFNATVFGRIEGSTLSMEISRTMVINGAGQSGYAPTVKNQTETSVNSVPVNINIPPCLRGEFNIPIFNEISNPTTQLELSFKDPITQSNGTTFPALTHKRSLSHKLKIDTDLIIPSTDMQDIPTDGKYLIDSSIEPFKFDWFLVRAVIFDATYLK